MKKRTVSLSQIHDRVRESEELSERLDDLDPGDPEREDVSRKISQNQREINFESIAA